MHRGLLKLEASLVNSQLQIIDPQTINRHSCDSEINLWRPNV